MIETIVIAEMNNNAIHPSTAELVAAAGALGSEPTLIVPCTDASAADVAKYQLTGTPSFVLDGKLLEAHDWPSLEKRLKDAI